MTEDVMDPDFTFTFTNEEGRECSTKAVVGVPAMPYTIIQDVKTEQIYLMKDDVTEVIEPSLEEEVLLFAMTELLLCDMRETLPREDN